MTAHLVVLGGGISGLAAAHRVGELWPAAEVTLVEAAPRLGGLLGSERADGYVLETGADSILTEKPWALDLIERLGIGDQLVRTRDAQRGAYVVARGRLERIPAGFSLMAPTDLGAFLRSPILSWRGKARTLLEPLVPRGHMEDESLAHFVTRRFGRELLERLAQPLVSGIYGADAERLSLGATMPRFLELERAHRSVIRGLRARQRQAPREGASGARYGMFVALRDGMQALVDALAARLGERMALSRPARSLERRPAGGYRVHLEGGGPLEADGVIVALPAHRAADVLSDLDPLLAKQLAAIPYGSAATATFAWPSSAITHPLDAFGFIVPRGELRRILACTWSSVKYPGRAPDGRTLLRVFFGGESRGNVLDASDAALARAALDELRRLMGIRAEPELVRIRRYPRAMPWYVVGHRQRVAAIERRLARHPNLALAGNAYDGVGIPDAVHRAERMAEACVEALRGRAPSESLGQASP